MAFDQSNFATVGAQSANSPKVFSYKTTDSLSAVLTDDYFRTKRFQLSAGDMILADISSTFHIITVVTSTSSLVTSQEQISVPNKQKVINNLTDFPMPSSGVITLDSDTFYLIGDDLDPTTDRFVLSQDTVVAGLDSSTSSITYTGTGDMFTATDTSNKITLLTLDCPNGALHNITNPGAGAAVFQLVNCTVDSCDTVGTLSNLTAVQYTDVAFNDIKTDGITFSGTIPVFVGNTDLVTINGGGTLFDLGTTVFDTFTIDASFVTLAAGATFLSGLTSSGNISAGNSGSVTNIKTFGSGTPLSGITVDDVRWFFSGNDDIPDTKPVALLNFKGNSTVTSISAASTDGSNAVLVAGTWTCTKQSLFTCTAAGRVTSNSERPFASALDVIATINTLTADTVAVYIALNGTPITATGISQLLEAGDKGTVSTLWDLDLNKTDFLEVFVENQTDATDITVIDIIFRASL